MEPKEYVSSDINVYFTPGLCIHAAECVKGLPSVFNTKKRPWINPENGVASAIAEIVERCPSGALQYIRHDNVRGELPEVPTIVNAHTNGQLEMRGDLHFTQYEQPIVTYRAVVCGCGQTGNSPFCDKKGSCQ
ncbi:(4Fe-4S)-binding protein [Chryseomicrobium sp. FSL W7-1435]|uniref:(4Fe-4S)-binding protein n=1 Tax=Chryseomicrobium sp. FSL W7-1435 TaxID=2921704 RepID=UPI00315A3694